LLQTTTLDWLLTDSTPPAQVNSAETAQLAQLVPTPATFEKVSKEYAERAHVALETIDVALEQLQLVPTANTVPLDGTVFDASPVQAWLYDTLISVESNLGAIQVRDESVQLCNQQPRFDPLWSPASHFRNLTNSTLHLSECFLGNLR